MPVAARGGATAAHANRARRAKRTPPPPACRLASVPCAALNSPRACVRAGAADVERAAARCGGGPVGGEAAATPSVPVSALPSHARLMGPEGAAATGDAAVQVLYEDEELVAVAKPAGTPSHPASRLRGGSLLNRLAFRLGREPRLVRAPRAAAPAGPGNVGGAALRGQLPGGEHGAAGLPERRGAQDVPGHLPRRRRGGGAGDGRPAQRAAAAAAAQRQAVHYRRAHPSTGPSRHQVRRQPTNHPTDCCCSSRCQTPARDQTQQVAAAAAAAPRPPDSRVANAVLLGVSSAQLLARGAWRHAGDQGARLVEEAPEPASFLVQAQPLTVRSTDGVDA
eukprot:scaffold618_cov372-Prasinococcus_capsulatus_cf.AAC.8